MTKEKLPTIKVITDAAVIKETGKYKGRAGVVILNDDDTLMYFYSTPLGNVTSNEGEYRAMLEGITYVKRKLLEDNHNPKATNIELYTDSSLVFNQLLGNYKTKKANFVRIQKDIKFFCTSFNSTKIIWHRRSHDLAMLADFASKHPRRTASMSKAFTGKPVDDVVTKAVNFILKDESKKEK